VADAGNPGREVQLWWASCAAAASHLPVLEGLLDPGERQRADRLQFAEARDRFITAHALVRELLGRATGRAPSSLAFMDGARGKPRLVGSTAAAPFFNISHSGDTAVVALATSEIGVDVETIRPVPNLDRLSRRFCSTSEQDWLLARRPVDREAAFLGLWTCKEAYLKAVGSGVAMPLRDVVVEPAAPRLRAIAGDPNTARGWTLLRADLPEPAVCTVAVRRGGWTLAVHEHRW
jgi:4'-phosphopantetheinyl transferase